MKRLLLVLLFLSTVLFGEEVKEKESFKPSIYWGTWALFQSNTVGRKTEVGDENWNNSRNVIKLESEIEMRVTPKLSLYIDDVNGINYPSHDNYKIKDTQFKLKYNNGKIGDTKLSFEQYLRYRKSSVQRDDFRYQPRLNFGEYLGGVVYIALDFDHWRYDHEKKYKAQNAVWYDMDGYWSLGHGFGLELELYGQIFSKEYDNAKRRSKDVTTNIYSTGLTSILSYNKGLYNKNNHTIFFHGELKDELLVREIEIRGGKNQTVTMDNLILDMNVVCVQRINQITVVYMKPGIKQVYNIEHYNHNYAVNGYVEVGIEARF